MIVICAGIMRSGSTWSYNVALELVKLTSVSNVRCGYSNKQGISACVAEVEEGEAGIYKCHDPSDHVITMIRSGEVKCIITIRNPLDCIASRQQFQADEPLERSVQWVKNNIYHVVKMTSGKVKPLVLRYEDMMANSGGSMMPYYIAQYLKIPQRVESLDAISSTTDMESTKEFCQAIKPGSGVREEQGHLVDAETCLHDNHIIDGRIDKWREVLGESADLVKGQLKYEMKFLGYEEVIK